MEKLNDITIEKSANGGFDFKLLFDDGKQYGIRVEEGDGRQRVAGLLRYVADCLDGDNAKE